MPPAFERYRIGTESRHLWHESLTVPPHYRSKGGWFANFEGERARLTTGAKSTTEKRPKERRDAEKAARRGEIAGDRNTVYAILAAHLQHRQSCTGHQLRGDRHEPVRGFDSTSCSTGYYVTEYVVNTVVQDVLVADGHIPIRTRTGAPCRAAEVVAVGDRIYDVARLARLALGQRRNVNLARSR